MYKTVITDLPFSGKRQKNQIKELQKTIFRQISALFAFVFFAYKILQLRFNR